MRCDECGGLVLVSVVGHIGHVNFTFCSAECRAEFKLTSDSIGHLMEETARKAA